MVPPGEFLAHGPSRGSPASPWLSTSHSTVTTWVEHRAEPGMGEVRKTGKAAAALLGFWLDEQAS